MQRLGGIKVSRMTKRSSVEIDAIIEARENTHGSYSGTAEFAQSLKELFRSHPNWGDLEETAKETIDSMCTKFARIMNGNPRYKDHWVDLAGYPSLEVKELT